MAFVEKVNQMMQTKHGILSDASRRRGESTDRLRRSLGDLTDTFMQINQMNRKEEEAEKQREHEVGLVGLRGEEQRKTQEAASDYQLTNQKELAEFKKSLRDQNFPVEWEAFGQRFSAGNEDELQAEFQRLDALARMESVRLRDALDDAGVSSEEELRSKYFDQIFNRALGLTGMQRWDPYEVTPEQREAFRKAFHSQMQSLYGDVLGPAAQAELTRMLDSMLEIGMPDSEETSEGGGREKEPGERGGLGAWQPLYDALTDFLGGGRADQTGETVGQAKELYGEAAEMSTGDMRGMVSRIVEELSGENLTPTEETTIESAERALDSGATASQLQAFIEPLKSLLERYGGEPEVKTGRSEGLY